MNNSKLAIDRVSLHSEEVTDNSEIFRKREGEIIKIIEAINGVNQSQDWSTLKTEIFESLVNSLEKQLRDEAKKEEPDPLVLNRVAGQLKWAEKYADLNKLANIFRDQLKEVRLKLYGKTES